MKGPILDLLRWGKEQGVKLNGVKPTRIPGQGIGVVATRRLKPGDEILTVPIPTIRSLPTVPEYITRQLGPEMTIHGLLAADLALDETDNHTPWRALLPARTDFEACTPLMWPDALQDLLPKTAKDILLKHREKFHTDWAAVSRAFPRLARDEYMHAWLLVNTRTFSYATPAMEKYPWDDQLALVPIADLINHADSGCVVAYSSQGFTVMADREYHKGEEVHISYGDYSNDFLLAEYGFVMARNRWDAVCLDDVLLPRLSARQKKELEDGGFLGGYLLTAEGGACARTRVALRLLARAGTRSRKSSGAGDEEDMDWKGTDIWLIRVLEDLAEVARKTMVTIADLEQVGLASQRELLALRWGQIEVAAVHATKQLNS
ncbi:hypothetical protein B0T22DRAFT_409442 [Podospora appendiculata]|uniref:SET domain-containing protein n=1 Tax=Podospora appendiculata TaxID=314037 RepID=A0AAE0X4S5_9PEZI|nr:hypothetical protein B0T22DRAFT_409442 [Podospora appendiculata]